MYFIESNPYYKNYKSYVINLVIVYNNGRDFVEINKEIKEESYAAARYKTLVIHESLEAHIIRNSAVFHNMIL